MQVSSASRVVLPNGTSRLETLKQQIHKLEVEELYPRLVLLKALSKFKNKPQERQRTGDDLCEKRRDFLDAFAYLCDVEKGGSTVTATALEEGPNIYTLWLAANDGIRDGIWSHADTMVKQIRSVTHDTQEACKNILFDMVVQVTARRIQYYKDKVQHLAKGCRMSLRNGERHEAVNSLRRSLKRLSEPPAKLSTQSYITMCFEMRDSVIKDLGGLSKVPDDDFSKLAHYIWRLGATREKVELVIDTVLAVPTLRKIMVVRALPIGSSGIAAKTLDKQNLYPFEILYSILKVPNSHRPSEIQSAFLGLLDHDYPALRRVQTEMFSKTTIHTRIHAELQLADRFSRAKDKKFVGGDKYIGCSKPACYFCYNWMHSHKYRYEIPATHHKIIPSCRGPDHDLHEKGAQILLDTYSKISKQAGQDILEFLQQSNGTPTTYHMSTGVPSQISGNDV